MHARIAVVHAAAALVLASPFLSFAEELSAPPDAAPEPLVARN